MVVVCRRTVNAARAQKGSGVADVNTVSHLELLPFYITQGSQTVKDSFFSGKNLKLKKRKKQSQVDSKSMGISLCCILNSLRSMFMI